jgi:hypothetical protein
VSGGTVNIEASRFLAGKTRPAQLRAGAPGAPSFTAGAAGAGSTALAAGTYYYFITGVNELGESPASASVSQVAAAGDTVTLTITAGSGTTRHFNVYRSLAGGTAASAKFIGRVANVTSPTFVDIDNRAPASVTCFLVEAGSMGVKELSPYSTMKLAVTDLSIPTSFFRFACLAVTQPRHNVLLDNVTGSF